MVYLNLITYIAKSILISHDLKNVGLQFVKGICKRLVPCQYNCFNVLYMHVELKWLLKS